MDNAFQWVEKNGIVGELSYPYTSGTGTTGTCKQSKEAHKFVHITGYTDVPAKDENALKAAVSKQPVSVAIEADKSAFQLYKGGILDNSACGTNLDHGVLVVGYGTDSSKDYWKVKNSWGTTWGEEGYIRMVRNKNQCGISQQPSYPTGATVAPGPVPTPPPPTPPPPPSTTHYGHAPCFSDEKYLTIKNTDGGICAPHCDDSACPTDIPAGALGKPGCVITGTSLPIKRYCALTCSLALGGCAKGFDCEDIGLPLGVGVCIFPEGMNAKSEESAMVSNSTFFTV